MKFNRRTILITGGGSGIGLELARQLLARDNTVIVTGRDAARLSAARQALPGLHTFQSDVGDPVAIAALHAAVLAQFPALDTLINNAGIMRNLDLRRELALGDLTREIQIDLTGPVQMVAQFLPHFRARQDALIVNVSSGLAFIPYTIAPIYSAAKAGLHAYTQALRMQLAGSGVTVVELAPPPTETLLFRAEFGAETRGQKGMDPATLVRQAIAGIEADRTEIRPGLSNVLRVMGRVAPQFMFRQMTRMSVPKP